jgi:hypothetical protein
MGMSLDNGGHLTHGHKVSITGKFWIQVPYGVHQKTEMLDYDEIKKLLFEKNRYYSSLALRPILAKLILKSFEKLQMLRGQCSW